MSVRFAINGRFLTRAITGVDRYAREVVYELDKIISENEAILVVPTCSQLIDPLPFEKIKVIEHGKHSGHIWEQVDFSGFLLRHALLGVNLCNTAPMRNPGLVVIHDMNIRANPSFYSWRFRTAYRLSFGQLCRHACAILTDTEFSKREIMRYYPTAQNKVGIAPCAWQHIKRIDFDKTYLSRTGIQAGSYYFAMSSLAPNKNLRWIVETALLNPTELFLVAGGINKKVFGHTNIPEADNVIYLGYVTDKQAKALMQGCKGFLFPTFYEGFGIPPMEALACGAPIAVSDNETMHEVYGATAHYVHPRKPCRNLEELFAHDCESPESILNQYSWQHTAESMKRTIESIIAAE